MVFLSSDQALSLSEASIQVSPIAKLVSGEIHLATTFDEYPAE